MASDSATYGAGFNGELAHRGQSIATALARNGEAGNHIHDATTDRSHAANHGHTAGHSHAADHGDAAAATVSAGGDSGNEDTKQEHHTIRPHIAGWTELEAAANSDQVRAGSSWAGSAAVYEWDGEYGDVGPRLEELEQQLFGGEHVMRQGEHFQNLELEVTVEGPVKLAPIREFKDAGLHPVMMENIKLARYHHPTPIQSYTLPAVRRGMDVVGIAQPGSGKTAAFLIPIIDKLMGKAKSLQAPRPYMNPNDYNPRVHAVKAEPLAVIVVPARELAIQIFDEARRLCYRSMLRPCVAYGGFPVGKNIDDLGKGCDILIATPGRLVHLMDKPNVLTMSRVKFTVIDEADEMLHDDWEEELRKIMTGGDTNEDGDHVYMMFSATFPKNVRAMAREYMAGDYVRIHFGRIGSAHRNIRQEIIEVDQDRKRDAVHDLLMSMTPSRTLIFCNSKMGVDLLDDFLYNKGFPTTSIHSDRPQRTREDAMRAFRTGLAPILIATGISARGWDIANVHTVINYDLPSAMHGGIDEYTHRIGRTARMGNQGTAYSFYNDRNEDLAQDLVNVLLENKCAVPEFLQHLVPEDGNIDFHDASDDEEATGGIGDGNNGEDSGAALPESTANEGFTTNGDAAAADSAW